MFVAKILYRVLKVFFLADKQLIQRKGISYEVDLTEGIDLSLFLFGSYQSNILKNKYLSLPSNAVVFDIGANIGSMTLSLAHIVTNGLIYAFEPTDYAFNKLMRNINLNPELASRITPFQLFLSDKSQKNHKIKAYSSWKIKGTTSNTHPVHGGNIKPAESIQAITVDDFCAKNRINRLDLIKIDTDGHEIQVLAGASKTIRKYKPYVIFEIGQYIIEEYNISFEQYFNYFPSLVYTLYNSKNGKKISLQNFHVQIPERYTTDIIAVPLKRITPSETI
ncbi:MAG: FkbM family methyltransferase [Thermodesulfobacteriota bacterium]|nr:FkbM family methyltransferase [Thermodesulfobacteriota bacterium]